MPQPASAISRDKHLRLLVMGPPKCGKTTSIVSTAPGPVYVINCDKSKSALQGAARRTKNFEWDLVRSDRDMSEALKNAREGVKSGKFKSVVLDTLSSFAATLEEECLDATDTGKGPDGRRAYPMYERRLRHVCEHLFHLEAHVFAVSHYLDLRGEVDPDKQMPKSGDGIAPLLAGKARATVPMLFDDVIFMDYIKGERIFVTNPQGAWGPGCRSLEGSEKLPADVSVLIKAFEAQDASDKKQPLKNHFSRDSKERSTSTEVGARNR